MKNDFSKLVRGALRDLAELSRPVIPGAVLGAAIGVFAGMSAVQGLTDKFTNAAHTSQEVLAARTEPTAATVDSSFKLVTGAVNGVGANAPTRPSTTVTPGMDYTNG